MKQDNKKQGLFALINNFKLAMKNTPWDLKKICFVGASIVSALINLVFISNLTKSDYWIGTLFPIPAAIVLGCLSIILDLVKILHVTQVNTLDEIYTSLGDRPWKSKFKKIRNSWFAAYLLYVALSVLTSVSLSTISIGAGITRNSNTIKQINEYILDGQKYVNVNKATSNISMETYVNGANVDIKNADAVAQATNDAKNAWLVIEPSLTEYQNLRQSYIDKYGIEALRSDYEHTEESKIDSDTLDAKQRALKNLLSSKGYTPGANANGDALSKLNEDTITKYIKNNKIANNTVEVSNTNLDKLDELKGTSVLEAYQWLKDVNKAGFVNPETGKALVVEVDENKDVNLIPIQVNSAIKELKALKVDVENDSGDIGSSSKIFMQIGSMIENKNNKQAELSDALDVESDGSFGATEIMMMGVLLFLSLLCELAINQCSPRTPITRDVLRGFMQDFPSDFNVSDYMIDILIRKLDFGEITKEEFDKQIKECIERKDLTREKLLADVAEEKRKKEEEKKIEAVQKYLDEKPVKVSKPRAKKVKVEESKVITETVKEEKVPEAVVPEVKEEPKKEEVKEPEPIKEEKSNKIFVKPAESEISEMLNG